MLDASSPSPQPEAPRASPESDLPGHPLASLRALMAHLESAHAAISDPPWPRGEDRHVIVKAIVGACDQMLGEVVRLGRYAESGYRT